MDSVRKVSVKGVRWLVREDLADYLEKAGVLDIAQLVSHPSAVVVKKGGNRHIYRVTLQREDGEPIDLFVKVFRLSRMTDLVRYVFRPGRGMKEWRVAGRLKEMGIPASQAGFMASPSLMIGVRNETQ